FIKFADAVSLTCKSDGFFLSVAHRIFYFLSFCGGDIFRPFVRRFSKNILGQRLAAQPLQTKGKWKEWDVPWEILAVKVQPASNQTQDVLHRKEMSHLFLGNAQDGLLPFQHCWLFLRRNLRPSDRIGSIKILDHERMLDFG